MSLFLQKLQSTVLYTRKGRGEGGGRKMGKNSFSKIFFSLPPFLPLPPQSLLAPLLMNFCGLPLVISFFLGLVQEKKMRKSLLYCSHSRLPNHHQRWYAKMEARLEYIRYTFGANLFAQSVLINKLSALDLGREFIESALLVGYVLLLGTITHTHSDLASITQMTYG